MGHYGEIVAASGAANTNYPTIKLDQHANFMDYSREYSTGGDLYNF